MGARHAVRLRQTRHQEFLLLLVLMYSILFVDRAKVAAAAGVMQKELDLNNIALSRCVSTAA